MLVVLSADMEGISQLRDPHSILAFERSYWEQGQRQMNQEVAAAARGLLDGGADEVVVLDNHGSGNPENIMASALPAGARLGTWRVFELSGHGADAMLQVGYHARAGVPAYISHTYVPGLRLRFAGELVSESHGRAWASRVPLLGIIGNDVHRRTLGSLSDVPYLISQHTSTTSAMEPAFPDAESAEEAIARFCAEAVRGGGILPRPAAGGMFEAAVTGVEEAQVRPVMEAAGWRQTGVEEYAMEIDAWDAAEGPLGAAMGAAFLPWMPAFAGFDLTSREALEAVHDEPALQAGREQYARWLDQEHQEWPGAAGAGAA